MANLNLKIGLPHCQAVTLKNIFSQTKNVFGMISYILIGIYSIVRKVELPLNR